jgi:Domain of unknown function (DUF1707)
MQLSGQPEHPHPQDAAPHPQDAAPHPQDAAPHTQDAAPHTQDAAPRLSPAIRVSDQDRDHVAQILQAAFAEGRLDDEEFDERMRAALTARTSGDLETLSADLPATASRPVTAAADTAAGRAAAGRKPGRLAIAYKNSIRRGGRWRVPEHFTSVVYKGAGWLDLRAAELTAPESTVLAVAYKSRIDVLVPPGVRVELDGFGVSKGWSEQEELESLLPRDAPVVHVRGVAYKGTIEVSTRPPAK